MPAPRAVESVRTALRFVLAAAMVWVGVQHFVNPGPFVRIVPPGLPAPLALVYLSGVFEIALGLAVLVPRVRRAAGWGLVALYIAVFPANVYMALARVPFGTRPVPDWMLWARLPFQAVFIAWALWVSRPDRSDRV